MQTDTTTQRHRFSFNLWLLLLLLLDCHCCGHRSLFHFSIAISSKGAKCQVSAMNQLVKTACGCFKHLTPKQYEPSLAVRFVQFLISLLLGTRYIRLTEPYSRSLSNSLFESLKYSEIYSPSLTLIDTSTGSVCSKFSKTWKKWKQNLTA